jgi:hypothetical protein
MKKCLLILLVLTFFIAPNSKAGQLRAYLSHASFYAPGYGPYLETYLSILGKSVQFVKTENGKFQGTVSVTMLFKQNDSIKDFRKYDLHTAEIEDTTHINFILFDQQRIALPAGKFELQLELADKNLQLPAFKATDEIILSYEPKSVSLSDVELVESYTKATETSLMAKSGYDFIPYQDYFFPQSISKITYYLSLIHISEPTRPY